jgi:hypothetical protein
LFFSWIYFSVRRKTTWQKDFGVRAIKSTWESPFAAQIVAVRDLPYATTKKARQSLCRAQTAFCHGKGRSPVGHCEQKKIEIYTMVVAPPDGGLQGNGHCFHRA